MLLALAASSAIGSSARAGAWATFDLRIIAYCHSAGCGFGSDDALRQALLDFLAKTNRIWQPIGISFRPLGGDLVGFVAIQYGGGLSTLKTIDPITDAILKAVANLDTGFLTAYFFEDLTTCGSPGSAQHEAFACGIGFPAEAVAHELGHTFCLPHTHTGEDAADNSPVDRDGDDADLPDIPGADPVVLDTPADPGIFESDATQAGADRDSKGNLLDGHEWCAYTKQGTAASPSTDPGSYYPTYCTVACKQQVSGATQSTSFSPLPENTMSYYNASGGCMGPYVLGGVAHEGFTPDQVAKVVWCEANVAERIELDEVCGTRRGDTDDDGICDDDDDCPGAANTDQADGDGDGDGDVCDLCPKDAVSTGDLDGDGIGDFCDPDDDDDGCDDGVDQHPGSALEVLYIVHHPLCPGSPVSYIYGSEGANTDGTGPLNCEDKDDDGDGISDTEDPCPLVANGPCTKFEPCGAEWKLACLGGECNEIIARISWVVNPDPTRDAIFGRVGVVSERLYLWPLANTTLSQSAAALLGDVGSAVTAPRALDVSRDVRKVELFTVTGRSLGVVGYIDPDAVDPADLALGRFLVVTPSSDDSQRASVTTAWVLGVATSDVADSDRDGIPDPFDDCTLAADPGQLDADHDGFGNRCDPDLDQDGRVTQRDLERVRACFGANVELVAPYAEGGATSATSSADVLRGRLCATADLDGDGRVGGRDLGLAARVLGKAPGPSGLR